MVALSAVQSSNALISSTLPPNLIAVFVGATSGIGETSLKQFVKHARQPHAYLVGRTQEAGDRIVQECKALNSEGEYVFVKADVSLIRVVDEVCEGIKKKEKWINLLFLSAGEAIMDRRETSEHLHLLPALTFYSRTRFMTNLLPLMQAAPALRRVVTVGGGTLEGPIDATDFPARRVPLLAIRKHLCTLLTLGLEAVAKTAPTVSFVHDYPGTVDTNLLKRRDGWLGTLVKAYVYWLGRWICVPLEECGERHLYLSTSGRYPASSKSGDGDEGVKLGEGVDVARGTDGEVGSGIYSVGWDGESAPTKVVEFLADLRTKGVVEDIWTHTESEFKRIIEQCETS